MQKKTYSLQPLDKPRPLQIPLGNRPKNNKYFIEPYVSAGLHLPLQ